jgi:hypothetical protein
MKESELNNRISQMLNAFESIENIQPQEGWSQSLMDKLSSAKRPAYPGHSKTKFIVAILFIVLMNIGFILSTIIKNDSRNTLSRNNDLQVISKELLINPTSLNN